MTSAYKVVLLGEGRVGKTSLVSRFVANTFDPNTRSTTQAGMYTSAHVPLLDTTTTTNNSNNNSNNTNNNNNNSNNNNNNNNTTNGTVTLHIWDTAGQERFHALGPIYYRNADGALLVYDITDGDTLEKVHLWIREVRAVVGDAIQFVICGNKADREEERDIAIEKAEIFAQQHNALHFITSAKTGMNVMEAFQALATRIAQSKLSKLSKLSTISSKLLTTGTGGRDILSGNSVVEATARGRRRRGQLRIKEEDEEEEEIEEEKEKEHVLEGKVITGARRTNPSTIITTTTGIVTAGGDVNTLSKEDYMYDDMRNGNGVRSGLVDLRVQPPQRSGNRGNRSDNGNTSSDSSGRYSCCA